MRRFTGDRIVLATHNDGKLAEMGALFAPHGIAVVGAAELGLAVPAETEATFVGNARLKARAAMEATGSPALADDSGITVDGLDGAPGVHTADWAETPEGRDFVRAMTRIWEALDARGVAEPRSAQFRATLVLVWPDEHEELFDGVAPGRLVWPIRGSQGHGYDPIFVPDGETRTFAEMTPAEKNRISHRAAAFRKLEAILG